MRLLTEDHNGKLIRSEPKTPKSRRELPIPQIAIEALTALRATQGAGERSSGYLFSDSVGGPIRKSNFITRVQKALMCAIGLPAVTFHALRHTFATRALLEGMPIALLSQMLGHASIKTTVDLYGHLQGREALRSVAVLQDRLYGEPLKLVADSSVIPIREKRKTRNPLTGAGFDVVEVRRLELLTP